MIAIIKLDFYPNVDCSEAMLLAEAFIGIIRQIIGVPEELILNRVIKNLQRKKIKCSSIAIVSSKT